MYYYSIMYAVMHRFFYRVKEMSNYNFHGMNISQLVIWFFIYSFFGWAMECVVIRREKGYWENRGFAKLPFCVIYGFGTFIALNIFKPIQDNYLMLYIAGAIGATIFEYLTAVVMNKLFGEVWWDYTNKKFNYKGVLCLESTVAWGFLALFIFGFLNGHIEHFVMSLNERIVMLLSFALCFSYFVDFSYHFVHSYLANKKNHEEAEEYEDADEEVSHIKKA